MEVRSPYLLLVPAGDRDANGLIGPFELRWFAFDSEAVCRAGGSRVSLELAGSRVHRSHLRPLEAAELRTAVALFRRIGVLWRRPDLPSQLRTRSLVLEALALWADAPARPRGEDRAVRIYRDLIEQYADDPDRSLEELAGRVGMSVNHLSVLFLAEMGMTPVSYRTRLRLLRARELLVSTVLPVARIAREVGFADGNYFARAFRRAYGMNPREFSRAHAMGPSAGSIPP